MDVRFVVITPAHNEAAFIGNTIAAVCAQTLIPTKWIIVNDGSTDETGAIVDAWTKRANFIECLNITRGPGRDFGQKALAFNRAVAQLNIKELDYIGNLDADILLEPCYFENMIGRFREDPNLGITGGIVYTRDGTRFVTYDKNPRSVGGAVQFFRRVCFEKIGGKYIPLPFGGIDAAAEFVAKKNGWKVGKSLNDRVFEQRPTGSAGHTPLRACLRLGRRFHSLGYGFFFYAFRCAYRFRDKPIVLGSAVAFLGYMDSVIRRRPVLLQKDVAAYMRREQRIQLFRVLVPWFPKGRL